MNLDSLRAWLLEDSATRVPLTLTALGLLFLLPLVGLSIYLWRMAARVSESGEFPPKGYKVLRPGPTTTGDAALRHVRAIRLFAIFFVIAALALVFMLWRFALLLR